MPPCSSTGMTVILAFPVDGSHSRYVIKKPFAVAATAGALITVPSGPSGSASGPAPTSASEQPAPKPALPGVHSASSHVAPPLQAPCGAATALKLTVTEVASDR